MMATAADYVIAEVEELVDLGRSIPIAFIRREFLSTLFSRERTTKSGSKRDRA